MAMTLYVVSDKFFAGLPDAVRNSALAEAKSILSFVNGYDVKAVDELKFPAAIDFTDAVIRVVADDVAIAAYASDSKEKQLKNIRYVLTQRGYALAANASARSHEFVMERAGVGWMGKEVKNMAKKPRGNDKVAITQTGGAAAVAGAVPDVLHVFAHNRDKEDVIAAQKKYQANHPGDYKQTQHYKETTADLAVWALADKPYKDWPKEIQAALGKALGRIIAHEARHQYVGGGHADEGLGGEAPALWGVKSGEQFDTDDQTAIIAAIRGLAAEQKTATVPLVETNPKGQAFPF